MKVMLMCEVAQEGEHDLEESEKLCEKLVSADRPYGEVQHYVLLGAPHAHNVMLTLDVADMDAAAALAERMYEEDNGILFRPYVLPVLGESSSKSGIVWGGVFL